MNAAKIYEADESDLLFGWFVAPCSLHDGLGSVNVSCIVAQPSSNQSSATPHVSSDLLLRLRQCLPQTPAAPAYQPYSAASGFPPTVESRHKTATRSSQYTTSSSFESSSNQRLSFGDLVQQPPVPELTTARRTSHRSMMRATDTVAPAMMSSGYDHLRSSPEPSASPLGIQRTISEESFTSFGSFSSGTSSSASDRMACAKIVPVRQQLATPNRPVSNLNDNERMMLDLLDKTISTQEILAAQQHEMANVIDYHGSQLLRISTAIERVETLLADSGERLKRMPQPKDRRSVS